MKDSKELLAESFKVHGELSQSRFDSARAQLMDGSWGPDIGPKTPVREGKSDGKKFWLPERDDRLIDELQRRAALLGVLSNRSQIVRASVHLFATLDDAQFTELIGAEIEKDNERTVKR